MVARKARKLGQQFSEGKANQEVRFTKGSAMVTNIKQALEYALAIGLTLLALIAIAALTVYPVMAAKADIVGSILNLDRQAQTLVVQEAEKRRKMAIAPNQQVHDVCSSDCMVEVQGILGRYWIAGYDKVVIEAGKLYYQTNNTYVVAGPEPSRHVAPPANDWQPAPRPEEILFD